MARSRAVPARRSWAAARSERLAGSAAHALSLLRAVRGLHSLSQLRSSQGPAALRVAGLGFSVRPSCLRSGAARLRDGPGSEGDAQLVPDALGSSRGVCGARSSGDLAYPWLRLASLEVLAALQRGSGRFRGARHRGESLVADVSRFLVRGASSDAGHLRLLRLSPGALSLFLSGWLPPEFRRPLVRSVCPSLRAAVLFRISVFD